MKFGINLNEASTIQGIIKLITAIVGIIMLLKGDGINIQYLLLLMVAIEGSSKVTMPDDQRPNVEILDKTE